jgi:HPr kinase/phosphorylase
MSLHGALVEVHGVGVLLLGKSGVGKSECALELVGRGHRLVADDVVELRGERGEVFGCAPDRIRHHMEIRGLGIIHIPALFGADAVRDEVRVDLVCRLEPWSEGVEYERVGLDASNEEICGVSLPSVTLPARPGGSMATVVDVAAREHLQRCAGKSAARALDQRLRREMEAQ